MASSPRRLDENDLVWVLQLNQAHQDELSPCSADRLRQLVDATWYAKVIEPQAAFLLAFDQEANYDSVNFLWFREQLQRFVYVDRVAVAASQRRQGHAESLYRDLFAQSAANGYPCVVCEVNYDPPNPNSDAFHAALGFSEMGREKLVENGKTVRYLRCDL